MSSAKIPSLCIDLDELNEGHKNTLHLNDIASYIGQEIGLFGSRAMRDRNILKYTTGPGTVYWLY